MIIVLIAVAAAAFVFFSINYLISRRAYKNATKIQRWNAAIEDAKEREAKLTPSQRIQLYLRMRGWNGGIFPPLAGAVVLYAICAVVLTLFGIKELPDALVSFALTWVIIVGITRRLYDKRREKFRRQLMLLMTMLATQIQDLGTGPTRALGLLVPQLEEPLGSEMEKVLAQVSASRNLVDALKELATRYPSRAFTMFILTLEMSDTVGGGAIAPSLRRVAAMLQRDFELTEEARAEVAQTKSEFYAVTAIIAFICFLLFTKSGPTNTQAYESTVGIVFLVIGLANYVLGIFRVRRALSHARGND